MRPTAPETGIATIADIKRDIFCHTIYSIRQADGTPVGSIASTGFRNYEPMSGAPAMAIAHDSMVTGGSEAFFGARELHNPTAMKAGFRYASIRESPGLRRKLGSEGITREVFTDPLLEQQVSPFSGLDHSVRPLANSHVQPRSRSRSADQIPRVLAHRVAVAQVVVAGQQAVEEAQVGRCRRDDAHGQRPQVAQRSADRLGCGRNNRHAAISEPVGRRSLPGRQSQRRQSSSPSRVLPQSGCSAGSPCICPMSPALSSRPCTTMTPVMVHMVRHDRSPSPAEDKLYFV